MRFIFLISFIFLQTIYCANAQTADVLLKEAEKLESSLKEADAYKKYKEVLKVESRNYEALWKCSELCSRIGHRQPTKAKKIDFFDAGKIYAETAIKVDPNSADGYYVLAVAMGRKALIESGDEKVKAVREIKTNAEKALKINPSHSRAWHVMGKWYYEVYSLSGLEKAALKIFYGGLPKATLTDAIRCYEKAKSLEQNFALNNLELAKAYKKDGQLQKAIELLKELPSIVPKTEDDARIQKEGKEMLDKISK